MPIRSCINKGKPGFKYGDTGKCYTYTVGDDASKNRAYNKASKQGQAIEIRFRHLPYSKQEER